MQKYALIVAALVLSAGPAWADSWDGQPVGTPALPAGPGYVAMPGHPASNTQISAGCVHSVPPAPVTTHPAPCAPGELAGFLPFTQTVSTLPTFATEAGSTVSLAASGSYIDPNTSLLNTFSGQIPLSDFATSGSVNVLQNEFTQLAGFGSAVNASLASLQTQINSVFAGLDQLNQALHVASIRADRGTAVAMAMAGAPVLQDDEHIAFSGNLSAFQGQYGSSIGVAYRLDDHVSVNADIAGSFRGGSTGGRVGIRFGW